MPLFQNSTNVIRTRVKCTNVDRTKVIRKIAIRTRAISTNVDKTKVISKICS